MTAATEPRTWTLLGDVERCLQAIRTGDGYFTDAGAAVTREPGPVTEDQRLVVGIRMKGLRRPEDPAARRPGGHLTGVLVEVRMAADREDAQFTLHCVVDDVDRATAGVQREINASASFPRLESVEFIESADGLPWVGADFLFTSHIKPR